MTKPRVVLCTKGWERRCGSATSPDCECACGGANHGASRPDRTEGVFLMHEARWHVVLDEPDQPLLIEDDSTIFGGVTVTNDVEAVVAKLVARGYLPEGRRLFYVDSLGSTDEIRVANGRFVTFAPGPYPHRNQLGL